MASPTTNSYTMPRTSEMATRNLLTTASTHPSSGDTSPASPSSNDIPSLHGALTNHYEGARQAASKALSTDDTDATSTPAGPSSPNATRDDLKRCQHERLFKAVNGNGNGNGAGYYSTSG